MANAKQTHYALADAPELPGGPRSLMGEMPPIGSLPTHYVDGARWSTDSERGDALQTALNDWQPGEVIKIRARDNAGNRLTYSRGGGGLVFRVRPTDAAWSFMVSTEIDHIAPGHRVSDDDLKHMPRILGTANGPHSSTIYFEEDERFAPYGTSAHHYWLAGIEITTNYSFGVNVVSCRAARTSGYDGHPHHIVLDRLHVHGPNATPNEKQYRVSNLVNFNAADSAIINCRLDNAYDNDSGEVHALLMTSGGGRVVVENNYISACAINVLLGGGDQSPWNTNWGDILFRRNVFERPPHWEDNVSARGGTFYDANLEKTATVLSVSATNRIRLSDSVGNWNGRWLRVLGANAEEKDRWRVESFSSGADVELIADESDTPNISVGDVVGVYDASAVVRPDGRGKWDSKNCGEMKNGRRVMWEANIFRGGYRGSQTGGPFVLTHSHQSDTTLGPDSLISDVLFLNNWFDRFDGQFQWRTQRGAGSGVNRSIRFPCPRVMLRNCLFTRGPNYGIYALVEIACNNDTDHPASDSHVIDHVTFYPDPRYGGAKHGIYFDDKSRDHAIDKLEIVNSIIPLGIWYQARGLAGESALKTVTQNDRYMCRSNLWLLEGQRFDSPKNPSGLLLNDVWLNHDRYGTPLEERFALASQYKGWCEDGSDPGCDVVALAKALEGVEEGLPEDAEPPKADTTPPTVAIISPANGSTHTKPFEVEVHATDETELGDITLYGNTAVLEVAIAPAGSKDYTHRFDVDPSKFSAGLHSVSAIARDAALNESPKATIYVVFGAPPSNLEQRVADLEAEMTKVDAMIGTNMISIAKHDDRLDDLAQDVAALDVELAKMGATQLATAANLRKIANYLDP